MSDQHSNAQGKRQQDRPTLGNGKANPLRAKAMADARRRIELLSDAQALGEILLDPWEDD